jgi:hypothetical protein
MNVSIPAKLSWERSIAVGLGTAILTSLVMVSLMKTGISPLPQPLGLAFASTLFDRTLPLPVGLLFHIVYVSFWGTVYARYLPERSLSAAFIMAFILWLLVLVVFFPIVGWGFAGFAISPKLFPASLLPHVLFGLFIWGLNRVLSPKST